METTIPEERPHAMARTERRRPDPGLVGIMLLAALLGLIYNGVVMLGYGPDETRHMGYVKMLLDEHRLPYLNPDGTEHDGAHTFHPPLYYLYLLPFYAASRALSGNTGAVPTGVGYGMAIGHGAPEWHFVRLVSMLLCLAALPLIYGIARRAGRGDVRFARLAVAQVALLPIFGQTSGTLNNDAAVLLAVSVFLWLLAVKYPSDRTLKAAVVLGVCMGLGALCKASALACDGVAFVIYLLAQDGRAALRPRNWARLGVLLLMTALVAGWWHVRSFELYGTWTPLPLAMPVPSLPNPSNGVLVLMMHPHFPPLLAMANWGIFYTMWSQKDWIPEAVRLPIYGLLAAYCFGALVSGVMGRRRRRAAGDDLQAADEAGVAERIAVWCPGGAFVVNWLAVLSTAMFMHWGWAEGGRYLLPSLSGLSIALARGWRGGLGASRRLAGITVGWCLALVALNALTIYWLLAYLNPKYGPPQ